MITLTVLAIILVIIIVLAILFAAGVLGVGVALTFTIGDIIIAALIIGLIIKLIFGRK